MRSALMVLLFSIPIIIFPGCGKKQEKPAAVNPEQSLTPSNPEVSPNPAVKDSGVQITNISDNPDFFKAKDLEPKAVTLDSLIRPVLVKIFGEARLIEEKGKSVRRDKEVVENELVYKVRMYIDPKSADDFHAELLAANFGPSPRLGSKPSHGRKKIAMSLFKTNKNKHYSLVFTFDLVKQTVSVESYRLGSKLDRL